MKNQFNRRVTLTGSKLPSPTGTPVKTIKPEDLLNITIKIRAGNKLPDLLSPAVYRRFKPFSREAFAQKFSSSAADVKMVSDFAHQSGLAIVKEEPHKRIMVLRGTVAQMETAFKVKLSNYKAGKGIIYRGRTGGIKIPAVLKGIVEGVFGLDNRPIASAKFKIYRKIPKNTSVSRLTAPASVPPYYPTDIANFYHFPTGVTGKHQAIGIIELGGGYRPEDIANYFKMIGLNPPTVVAISVDGGANNPTTADSADGEVLLDIEIAGGIASDASLIVYFAPNNNQGFLDAINQAVHDTKYKPSVISISWGSAEGSVGGWTTAGLNVFNEAFQAAAAMGVTICAASGDDGSNDNVNDQKAHVDFPASSPYVLACGGTRMDISNGKITSETVWNENPPNGGATGGGVSEFFPLPAYQSAAKVPVSINTKQQGRALPDVAAVADPQTGYRILVDGQQMQIGGTSAVAPMMAGLIALINEKLGKAVGFIHPKLYADASVCRDVIQGNNITVGSDTGYTAGLGYDACSGNGVPDGTKLMNSLSIT